MQPFRGLRLRGRTSISLHRPRPSRRAITSQRPRPAPQSLQSRAPTYTTHRAFNLPNLASFLPNSNNNDNESPKRVLAATRTLPYPPALLFKVISSVESYSQFLPFLTASTVTARDPQTGFPTQAFLTVGYGPLSETFTSRVDCDQSKGIVEARSGAKYGKPTDQNAGSNGASGLSGLFPGANEGIFEYLSTRWELVPQADGPARPQTKVNLEVRFEFRSQLHATMMSAVEGQMANVMIEAFEKRIRELHGSGR